MPQALCDSHQQQDMLLPAIKGNEINNKICTHLSFYYHDLTAHIVNKEEWLRSPANNKGANKDAKIFVGWYMTVCILLFCVLTLYNIYVNKTFLLVSFLVSSKQLFCFVHSPDQKREQKRTTKNLVKFCNHSPLLTMLHIKTHKASHIHTVCTCSVS